MHREQTFITDSVHGNHIQIEEDDHIIRQFPDGSAKQWISGYPETTAYLDEAGD